MGIYKQAILLVKSKVFPTTVFVHSIYFHYKNTDADDDDVDDDEEIDDDDEDKNLLRAASEGRETNTCTS